MKTVEDLLRFMKENNLPMTAPIGLYHEDRENGGEPYKFMVEHKRATDEDGYPADDDEYHCYCKNLADDMTTEFNHDTMVILVF